MSIASPIPLSQLTGNTPQQSQPVPLSQIMGQQNQPQPVPLSQVMGQQNPQPANPLVSNPLLQNLMGQAQAANATAKIAELAQPVNQQVQKLLPGATPIQQAIPAQQDALLHMLNGANNQQAAQAGAMANAQTQAQENNQQVIQQHPIAGRFANFANAASNALGQGVAAVQGLVNPEAAHATQQGLNITTPVIEGPEATAGGIVGGTLPVAGVSLIPGAGIPLSAVLMGAQAGGQARTDIAGLREQGANITPGQELKYATEQGGINVGLGLGLGAIGKVFEGLTPELQSAIRSGDQSALRSAITGGAKALNKSLSGAAINEAVGTASNALKQQYDPNTPIDSGTLQNIVTGALLPHLMGSEVSEQERTPAQQQEAQATMARRRGMAVIPGGSEGETPSPTSNEPNTPKSESAVPAGASETAPPNLKPPVPSLEEQANKGQQFEQKLNDANENFAEKAAQPLPPKPSGLLSDISKSANALKTIGNTTADAIGKVFPVEATGLKKLLTGKTSEDFESAKNTLRAGQNEAMNEHMGAMESLSHTEDAFNKLPVELQRDFQGRMYDNLPQATPELRGIADAMYATTEQRRQQIADLGVEAAQDWERQHWNMLWKQDPDQAAILRDRIYGSGKLGGQAAGTLKARTPGDFQSKLDAGLVPTFDNPLQQFAATDESQRRFIGMGRAVKGLAEDGTIVRTDKLPAGMVDITNVLPKSLADVVKGEEGHGIVAAPKDVADLIRNVATPSWFQGSPMRRGILSFLRTTNNFLTQIALGLSGFHLKKVFGLEQPAMTVAEGLGSKELFQGLPGRSERGETIQNAMLGLSDMIDPAHRQIIDALKTQMTARHEKFYDNNITTNFRDAIANRSPWEGIKSAVKAPFALSQKLTQDVIFNSVQRAKVTFAFDSLQKFISDNPEASADEIRNEAARIADHTDNLLGLMNRDNLLWNRTARDIASLSMLSVGWNYGTLRSLAGAGSELAGAARGRRACYITRTQAGKERRTRYCVSELRRQR